MRGDLVVRIGGSEIVGPGDRLFASFSEAAQGLSSGQIEWHGEHVVDD